MWGLFSSQVRKKSWACFVLYLLSYIQIVQQGFDMERPRVKAEFFCSPVSKD